jgi:delta 1-pyrroline-5-carboxylate dehydrogenase
MTDDTETTTAPDASNESETSASEASSTDDTADAEHGGTPGELADAADAEDEPTEDADAPAPEGRLSVYKTYKLYIDGQFPRTESGRYLQPEDSEGDFVANICRASRKDFRDAVVAAREALDGWSGRSAFNRGQILYRMAEMLEGRRHGFEKQLMDFADYSEAEAREEVGTAIDRLVWYAGWTDKFEQVFGSINPVGSPHFNFTTPEPTGVIALFAPQNDPLLGLISAIAPLIVSGNAIVAIVDNDAPMLAMEFAEVLNNSDLPGGVVNILTGLRSELAGHVGGHRDVDGVIAYGADDQEEELIGVEGAENVKRLKFAEDHDDWTADDCQSPYRIMPFVEFKTNWHPVGV